MFKEPRNLLFIIIIVSAGLRFFNLDFADGKPVFDERGYYVEAARSYLAGRDDPNPQHPPLGKELIAAGILLFGDNPVGWRMASLVFSLVGIVLVYLLGKEMGEKEQFIPLVSALLLSVDSMYFIYSRLAVMDMFLTVFVLLTMLFLWRTYRDGGVMNLVFLGVSFGLAIATKWTVLQLVPVMVVFLWLRARRRSLAEICSFAVTLHQQLVKGWPYDGNHAHVANLPTSLRQSSAVFVRFLGTVGIVGVIGGAVYVTTYAPYLTRHSIREFTGLQRKMVTVWRNFDQDRVFTPETYVMRHAYSWILNPVSAYFSEQTQDGKLRLVIGLYNPVILWGGLGWLVYALFANRKSQIAIRSLSTINHYPSTILFLLLPILSNFIPWFFIRRVQYPYYFLPSLPLLVLLVASVLDRARRTQPDRVAIFLLAAVIMFGYLFPFLTSVPANLALLNPLASGPISIRPFYDETEN